MCNDFGNHIPDSDDLAAFSQTRIPVKWPGAIPNLQPRDDIWPTDKAPVIRRLEDGTNEFDEIRRGFPPAQPKRPPVINFRSEGRRFPVGRCLIPASFFYEFTGTNPEDQVEIHEGWGGLVLLRRAMATHARRRCRFYPVDDQAGSGCGAHS
jgi:putative SOS response-associated peptidase YedK